MTEQNACKNVSVDQFGYQISSDENLRIKGRPMPINFKRFHQEQCGIKGIVYSWLDRAENTNDDFYRFYYLWSAFNSWALIVTLDKTDGVMIKSLSKDPELSKLYGVHCTQNENNLVFSLETVKESFPLQSFADLVRIDHMYDWRGNQGSEVYNRKIAESGKVVRVSPHLVINNFGSVLNCTYAVRCNLLHGSKMATPQERAFVNTFSNVLECLLLKTHNVLSLGH